MYVPLLGDGTLLSSVGIAEFMDAAYSAILAADPVWPVVDDCERCQLKVVTECCPVACRSARSGVLFAMSPADLSIHHVPVSTSTKAGDHEDSITHFVCRLS